MLKDVAYWTRNSTYGKFGKVSKSSIGLAIEGENLSAVVAATVAVSLLFDVETSAYYNEFAVKHGIIFG